MVFQKVLLIVSFCVISAANVSPPRDIVQGFENSDAKAVSNHFNNSVELIISNRTNVYSKAHAEQILRSFFNDNANPSGKFTYKHLHGSHRDNVQYFIGELHTGKGIYRITIHMKDRVIHQIRIESND